MNSETKDQDSWVVPDTNQGDTETSVSPDKTKKKKNKIGGKLSQEHIRNLPTDQLINYIENEGKKLK